MKVCIGSGLLIGMIEVWRVRRRKRPRESER